MENCKLKIKTVSSDVYDNNIAIIPFFNAIKLFCGTLIFTWWYPESASNIR